MYLHTWDSVEWVNQWMNFWILLNARHPPKSKYTFAVASKLAWFSLKLRSCPTELIMLSTHKVKSYLVYHLSSFAVRLLNSSVLCPTLSYYNPWSPSRQVYSYIIKQTWWFLTIKLPFRLNFYRECVLPSCTITCPSLLQDMSRLTSVQGSHFFLNCCDLCPILLFQKLLIFFFFWNTIFFILPYILKVMSSLFVHNYLVKICG